MLFVVAHTDLVTKMQYFLVCCRFRRAKCLSFPRTKLDRNTATRVAVRLADENAALLPSFAIKCRST